MTKPRLDDAALDLLFHDAHTAHRYLDMVVSVDEVERIWASARWAPSTMNVQPLRLVIAESAEARAAVLEHLSGSNHDKAAAAPILAVVCADTAFHDTLDRLVPHIENARDIFSDDARRERTAREQTWLQSGYLILGLRGAGLGCGPMLGYDAAGLDNTFLAGTSLVSVMVLTIGVPDPDGYRPRQQRLDPHEVMLRR
ncbi:MAG: malonic semialdehyde reductase [Ilumatobacteraceae bacterium]